MLRAALIERSQMDNPSGFRMRGREVSRLEGFSDCVFAFALTLLVVALEVPRTFEELHETMRGFISFAICFALLSVVWHLHYKFFRRYGLNDATTLFLNLFLLFLVLFYVYPLKFLWTLIVDGMVFHRSATVTNTLGQSVPVVTNEQVPKLMTYFGLGYAAVFFVFGLMYANALRLRRVLELDARETLETIEEVTGAACQVAIATLSIILAHIGRRGMQLSGMTYFLVPVALTLNGWLIGRRVRRLTRKN